MQAIEFKREALRRLPVLLADLFDEPSPTRPLAIEARDRGIDAVIDAGGRRWLLQAKTSSSPGTVDAAADQLDALADEDGIPALVVPYMTPAGARAADKR